MLPAVPAQVILQTFLSPSSPSDNSSEKTFSLSAQDREEVTSKAWASLITSEVLDGTARMSRIPKGSQDLSSFCEVPFKLHGRGAGTHAKRLWLTKQESDWQGCTNCHFTSVNVKRKAWQGHTAHTPAAKTKINTSSSAPRGEKVNFLSLIYLLGVWIGVYDFIGSPEMKEGDASSNCYLEPNLTDSCAHKGRHSNKLCRANWRVCLRLNGIRVCRLSLGKASMLSLGLVLEIIQGN